MDGTDTIENRKHYLYKGHVVVMKKVKPNHLIIDKIITDKNCFKMNFYFMDWT